MRVNIHDDRLVDVLFIGVAFGGGLGKLQLVNLLLETSYFCFRFFQINYRAIVFLFASLKCLLEVFDSPSGKSLLDSISILFT